MSILTIYRYFKFDIRDLVVYIIFVLKIDFKENFLVFLSFFKLNNTYLILPHLLIKNLVRYRKRPLFLPGCTNMPTDIAKFIFMIFHI